MAVARILVGITGGIAAYKACELVRLLVRAGHDVTRAAEVLSAIVERELALSSVAGGSRAEQA